MNVIKPVLTSVLILGLLASCSGEGFPPISFLMPDGRPIEKPESAPIKVIIDSGFVAYDNRPIRPSELVPYLNGLLQSEKTTSLAVYIRSGVSFGEVIKSLDELRKTDAKSIGVCMIELRLGQSL